MIKYELLSDMHRMIRNSCLYWMNIHPGKYDIIWARIWTLVNHIQVIEMERKSLVYYGYIVALNTNPIKGGACGQGK